MSQVQITVEKKNKNEVSLEWNWINDVKKKPLTKIVIYEALPMIFTLADSTWFSTHYHRTDYIPEDWANFNTLTNV